MRFYKTHYLQKKERGVFMSRTVCGKPIAMVKFTTDNQKTNCNYCKRVINANYST